MHGPRVHGTHHTARVHGHMLRSAHGPTQRTTSKDKAAGVYHVYKAVSMVKGINIIEHNKQTWVSAGYDDWNYEKHLDYHETTQDPNQI